LHVTPELADEHPEIAAGLVRASIDWCRKGWACVHVVVGHGTNEARIVDTWRDADADNSKAIAYADHDPFGSTLYFLRYWEDGSEIVWDSDRCVPYKAIVDPYWVAAHELGHFVGADHVAATEENEDHVMHPETQCVFTRMPEPP
jgi:hypothetical protein